MQVTTKTTCWGTYSRNRRVEFTSVKLRSCLRRFLSKSRRTRRHVESWRKFALQRAVGGSQDPLLLTACAWRPSCPSCGVHHVVFAADMHLAFLRTPAHTPSIPVCDDIGGVNLPRVSTPVDRPPPPATPTFGQSASSNQLCLRVLSPASLLREKQRTNTVGVYLAEIGGEASGRPARLQLRDARGGDQRCAAGRGWGRWVGRWEWRRLRAAAAATAWPRGSTRTGSGPDCDGVGNALPVLRSTWY